MLKGQINDTNDIFMLHKNVNKSKFIENLICPTKAGSHQ